MEAEQRKKKLEHEERVAKSILLKSRKALYGQERPHWFVQVNYYLCSILAGIAFIWHLFTYAILLKPGFLKRHKFVDVPAIVERRGNELGFAPHTFYETLQTFSLLSAGIWLILILSLIWLWRGKQFYVYIVIGAIVIYMGLLLALLGGNYFIEDTTWFDKLTLLLILLLTIVQNYLFGVTFPKGDQEQSPVEQ